MLRCTKANLPLGEHGDWKVEHFTISDADAKADFLRCAINPNRRMTPVSAGEYTKITFRGAIWMSDTPSEICDMNRLLWQVPHGSQDGQSDVLVTGLGLGCLAVALCANPYVRSLTVVEIEPAVIALVAPHIQHLKLRVVEADAYTWKPDVYFDVALHDIWMNICVDNLDEMARIRRHYQRSMRARSRQFCWREDEIKYLRQRGF